MSWQGAGRLREALKKSNRAELARKLGVDYTTLLHWQAGRRAPNLDMLAQLCRELGASADELLGIPRLELREPPADYGAHPVEQEWIPLVADVAAGEPMIAPRHEAEDWYAFKAKWVRAVVKKSGTPVERLFAVKLARGARGESMLPTIRPGASLVVDPGPETTGVRAIEDGRIYLCRPDGGDGWTVKRAWLAGGARYLVLKGDNPTSGAIVEDMKGRALRDVIVGRVIYVGQEEA